MVSEQNQQYTVLARRFRPKSFDEVVGQEHVGQAIQNAIKNGRVAHAYLFTGARGVGKTSTARIFAKALNCPNVKDGVPCNACDACQGIGAGNDVDVLEIDGASNRGIDDIRQLRANVSIRSMRSPYKVYIIDEVHMLTKEAFNALLKTLEEPPPNVKFVFCTTEPNKVPDTILSRCQRFDFGTIDQTSIAGRLKEIAEAEGKIVDDAAVELVARRAAGSMRDSQSLFDQLLAFGGERITADDVHQLLGTAPDERLIQLVESLIAGQPSIALVEIETALERGVQIGSFSDQLLAYFRDLLVSAAGAHNVSLSAVTESSREKVHDQAKRWGLQTITAAMQILAETKSRMQRATYSRALIELAIVRIASLEQLDQIAALLRAASGGSAAIQLPPRQLPPPAKAHSESNPGRQVASDPEPAPPIPVPEKIAPAAVPASVLGPAPMQPVEAQPEPTIAPPPVSTASVQPPPIAAPDPEFENLKKNSDATVRGSIVSTQSLNDYQPAQDDSSMSGEENPFNHQKTEPTTAIEFREGQEARFWEALLNAVPEKLADNLRNSCRRAIFGPNRLEIYFPKSYLFSKSYCENPDSFKKLVASVDELAGQAIDCRLQIDPNAESNVKAPPKPVKAHTIERRRPSVLDGDHYVQMVAAVFGGEVKDVRVVPEAVLPAEGSSDSDEE
ncbi:DNA polymerase III subunit gamma/tau [Planctomicrobium sp. SH668]|uniref:DNA polymerase III subunit gamma/tau n=1 Tax=Planctomicrobium sp. SH668 TaxID=3448126 RepID=UPI003F5C40ED